MKNLIEIAQYVQEHFSDHDTREWPPEALEALKSQVSPGVPIDVLEARVNSIIDVWDSTGFPVDFRYIGLHLLSWLAKNLALSAFSEGHGSTEDISGGDFVQNFCMLYEEMVNRSVQPLPVFQESKTTDGAVRDPNSRTCGNCAEYGEIALKSLGRNVPQAGIADTIADLLHTAHKHGENPSETLYSAWLHFHEEVTEP